MKNSGSSGYVDKMNEMGKKGEPFIFIIDYEMINPIVLPMDKAAQEGIYFTIDNYNNIDNQIIKTDKFTFKKYPVSYNVFKSSFDLVLNEIRKGNSFLTNLTFPTPITTNLTLKEIFDRSKAPYKLLFKDLFVVFSPELFIKIDGLKISSFPMKGTIDASDENARSNILSDPKETAEHHTIVDMIRSDLSSVSTNVKVERFRFLNEVITADKTLLQVSSEITGELPADFRNHLGDIFSKLLPAGSICGAPKRKTLEIIGKAENYSRGYYTGVFGIFDGQNLQSAVMIRFIEKKGQNFLFKSGGGITFSSDPKKEYQELIDKVYVPIH